MFSIGKVCRVISEHLTTRPVPHERPAPIHYIHTPIRFAHAGLAGLAGQVAGMVILKLARIGFRNQKTQIETFVGDLDKGLFQQRTQRRI